jgi:hypothetical protein
MMALLHVTLLLSFSFFFLGVAFIIVGGGERFYRVTLISGVTLGLSMVLTYVLHQ